MKYDLKEHGLIDKDGKVTLVGRIMLESALKTKEFLESECYNEFTPTYSECWNKNFDEIEKWESDNRSLYIGGSNEGCIEVTPTKFYTEVEGVKVWDNIERLSIVVVDDMFNSESHITIWSKENAIALRDYLTKFIEKDEDWYIMPKNI